MYFIKLTSSMLPTLDFFQNENFDDLIQEFIKESKKHFRACKTSDELKLFALKKSVFTIFKDDKEIGQLLRKDYQNPQRPITTVYRTDVEGPPFYFFNYDGKRLNPNLFKRVK